MPQYYQHYVYPRVPDFDDPDFDPTDRIALKKATEQRRREYLVKQIETKIIREKLQECWATEAPNELEHCRYLRKLFWYKYRTTTKEVLFPYSGYNPHNITRNDTIANQSSRASAILKEDQLFNEENKRKNNKTEASKS